MTTADRDTRFDLANIFVQDWRRMQAMTSLEIADVILASDWLADHDAAVTARVLAPIRAVLDANDYAESCQECAVGPDLRAVLDQPKETP